MYVLSTGYILVFYSEHMFWARRLPDQNVGSYLLVWLVYSVSGYAMLAAIDRFRVYDKHGVFLAGALFGWLTEGIIVQTTYEMLPFSLAWTGLAWHALISTVIGWYGLSRALMARSILLRLRWTVCIGLFWGFWGIFWQFEEPETAVNASQFVIYSFAVTIPLIPSYLLSNSLASGFRAGKWEIRLVAGLFLIMFVVVILFLPIALLVLPPLIALIYWALQNNRIKASESVLVLSGESRPRNYFILLVMPLTASIIYIALLEAQIFETGWLVYVITVPLGFGWFFYSVWRLTRRKALSINSGYD